MPVHNQTPGEGPFQVGVRGVDARTRGGPCGRRISREDRKNHRQSMGEAPGSGSPSRCEGTPGCDPGEVTSSPGVYQERGRTTHLPGLLLTVLRNYQ